MFRYIGLVWDPSDRDLATRAARLAQALTPSMGWESALDRHGIRVFMTGGRTGINQAYALAPNRGVVLGKLFRRECLEHSAIVDVCLDDDISHRVLLSEGRALIDEFWGRYIAFLPASGGARILRDPGGTFPCHLLQCQGVWIVFSWLEDVLASMPEVTRPTIAWKGISAHLLLGEIGGSATALLGVSQLLPGQAVDLRGDVESRQLLWQAVEIARSPSSMSVSESSDRLRNVVRGCVRSWASCYESLVLRLSGGVDSAIVLGCLGEDSPRVTCLNYYLPGSDADERSYARLAASRSRRVLLEMECEPTFRLDQALFTGGGGDQVFYEFRQWWPLADCLRLHGFDAGFGPAAMDAARLGSVSLWRAIRLAVAERLRPSAMRQDLGRQMSLLNQDALPTTLHESYVHPALLGLIELPIGKLTQTQQLMVSAGYYDPFELEAAPELVNPLLSQPVVELALTLPSYVLTHGGRGRALARRAFSELLPPEIAGRRSKGGMNAYIKGVLSNNLEFASTMLLDGELMRRGFLDRSKVEAALSNRPTSVASYASEVHILIGVEAWLRLWARS